MGSSVAMSSAVGAIPARPVVVASREQAQGGLEVA
jgi:hypothetical protein